MNLFLDEPDAWKSARPDLWGPRGGNNSGLPGALMPARRLSVFDLYYWEIPKHWYRIVTAEGVLGQHLSRAP
ncbi:MAG TPA: hypothetical protein VK542_04205, partial [Gemmatimonadaceae bacterium]|nr:hypothetical protein [Gemmatimonadaceae bacterium]